VPTIDLARHFGNYLARVRFGDSSVVVLKKGVAVAELRPLPGPEATLAGLLDLYSARPADKGFADALESVSRADQPLRNPWA
jgi:antitoxin (DNA-binding transcriptional repressor) of toxin-antitoxin stability system